jgi:iron(III) transport system substrate-binding protein
MVKDRHFSIPTYKHLNADYSDQRRKLVKCLAVGAASISAPSLVLGQDDERLKKARSRGKISWYSSVYPDDLRNQLANDFKSRTGLDVSVYAGGTGQVVSRMTTERKTGSFGVDVLDLADQEVLEGLIHDGVLRAYSPHDAKSIQTNYIGPNRLWSGLYFWVLTLEYNTKLYNASTAPKGFDDLTDPKFKGKVVLSDPARSAAGLGFLKAMVQWKGWDWVERLAKNEPLVVAIGPGVHEAVVSGERPIGTTVSSYVSAGLQQKAPVALAVEQMLFSSPEMVGIVKEAPNPDGAELFVDFLVSKHANELFRKFGWFSCRTDVPGPYGFPPAKELKFKYLSAPSIGMTQEQVAQKFHAMLRQR